MNKIIVTLLVIPIYIFSVIAIPVSASSVPLNIDQGVQGQIAKKTAKKKARPASKSSTTFGLESSENPDLPRYLVKDLGIPQAGSEVIGSDTTNTYNVPLQSFTVQALKADIYLQRLPIQLSVQKNVNGSFVASYVPAAIKAVHMYINGVIVASAIPTSSYVVFGENSKLNYHLKDEEGTYKVEIRADIHDFENTKSFTTDFDPGDRISSIYSQRKVAETQLEVSGSENIVNASQKVGESIGLYQAVVKY